MTPAPIRDIKHRHNEQIKGNDAVWESMMDCKSGFLVWLGDVRRLAPGQIDKKDMRTWVALTKEKDFGLLKGLDLEGNP